MSRRRRASCALVEERLSAIVSALDGEHVDADRSEFWFQPKGADGVEIRLGNLPQARCYDRSANFAISHGGQPTEGPLSADFRAAVDAIKRIDHTPIEDAAVVFRAAARVVARRLKPPEDPAATTARPPDADASAPELVRHVIKTNLRSAIVVGGGTAGYFAALALKTAIPELVVTLIESSKIPIIGVGEATTTLMPPFLHVQLGIDIVELYRAVRPTWKLGIKFDWGLPGDYSFMYPFGDASPVEAYAHDGHIANQSVCSLMMAADRSPIVIGDDGEPISLLEYMPFAYHLENKCFVAYLETCAQRAGIECIDAEITDVLTPPDRERVDGLVLDDGRVLRGDLYVDASGFRSLLIGKALGSPFRSYASSLFCDTAVVGEIPQAGVIEPYTTAETMDAGWCWRIPVEGEDHRGYVFSSAHITPERAREEMRAKNPGLGDTRTVRFRSGRHEQFWQGNTVGVGNAYGFVEPLESTALHMVILELRCLLHCLEAAGDGPPDRDFANRTVGAHWDYLRWFLAVHYKFNRKKDTEFWRACRESVDVSGIEPLLEQFRTSGPGQEASISPHVIPDPVFNYYGVVTMLLGQRVPCPPTTATWLSKPQWDARVAESKALVDRTLTQAQALELLRRRPELLRDLVTPTSRAWIIARRPQAEYLKIPGFWIRREKASSGGTNPEEPIGQTPADAPKESIPYGHLLEPVAPATVSGVDRVTP
jgi:tryptophan halogenase